MENGNSNDDKPVRDIGYDESFKILAKHFFSEFSRVVTDFEIIKLPKKADVLVVETEKPIAGYVRIFDYFKTVNIIEFKSVAGPFRMSTDIPKILVYIGGVILTEEKATTENTTFTVICSRKPEKLFRLYEKSIQKVKNGVYLLKDLTQVPVYVVVTNEVTGIFDKEMALIKEFSTGHERIRFIESVLHDVLNGNQQFCEFLRYAFFLYKRDVGNIIEREGMSMTIGEKNIREWVDELGLKDKYIKEGEKKNQLSVARKMLIKGFSIEDIMDTTELTREEVLKIQGKNE